MTDSSTLAGLLVRASHVFSLAGDLGRAFHEEVQSRAVFLDPAIWRRLAPTFNEFWTALLNLREAMQNPPDGFGPVADRLMQAAKLAKGIRETLARDDAFSGYLDLFPELNTVSYAGFQAVKEATKARRLDDPFAFVDQPAATPVFSLLDRFPATLAGHVAFLEWVRDEVHQAAEAKRWQSERGYSNATIESMVWGIKWAEARQRLAALTSLPADVREQVARVLGRDLMPGTVEWIDELLTPAVRGLREGRENRDRLQGNHVGENVSEKLPKTDDEAELLTQAVAELLRTVPDTWAKYEADSLTAAKGRALFLLVAAGMVERRIRCRLSMVNHPGAIEATMTATGEYGSVEAMQNVVAKLLSLWADPWRQWKAGESRDMPPFICESLKPDEWRLTDQGEIARKDLSDGETTSAIDFVLQQGFFDGPNRHLPDGRVTRREPVRGRGVLESLTEVPGGNVGNDVNIRNWDDGAKAFAEVFATHFAAMQEKSDTRVSHEPAKPPVVVSTPKKAKKSTERGEGRAKVIAALTKHHKYANGSCLNQDPIGNNAVAQMADVSASTASEFFNKEFDGYQKYRAMCSDRTCLISALKLLNQEFSPHLLYGNVPLPKSEQDDKRDEDE